jgi:hypothetical protein
MSAVSDVFKFRLPSFGTPPARAMGIPAFGELNPLRRAIGESAPPYASAYSQKPHTGLQCQLRTGCPSCCAKIHPKLLTRPSGHA